MCSLTAQSNVWDSAVGERHGVGRRRHREACRLQRAADGRRYVPCMAREPLGRHLAASPSPQSRCGATWHLPPHWPPTIYTHSLHALEKLPTYQNSKPAAPLHDPLSIKPLLILLLAISRSQRYDACSRMDHFSLSLADLSSECLKACHELLASL